MQLIRKFRNPRDFFSSLCWDYSEKNYHLPIFIQSEIENEPLKWLKYLLLEKVNATTIQELESTIQRYKLSERSRIIADCENLLAASNSQKMVVLKIVFFNKAGQLPNFRIYSSNEINSTIDDALNRFRESAYEMWTCHSGIDIQGSDLGGRISWQNSGFSSIPIEIVWFASPRLIESYRSINFDFPYLRAEKLPGTRQFNIKILNMPNKFRHSNNKYLKDFQRVLNELFFYENSILKLKEILFGSGANELCIEFKISNNRFSIIDWDTEIETLN